MPVADEWVQGRLVELSEAYRMEVGELVGMLLRVALGAPLPLEAEQVWGESTCPNG